MMNEPSLELKPQISCRNFNFYYGKYHALKNINLDIYKRNVTAFIGPSGCGKSTLLRTFNRMYELYPEQRAVGELLLDGKDMLAMGIEAGVQRSAELRTQIAFKDFNFYYGKYHALKNINLDIYHSQVTAFIGPSGCGKSTLLRTMNRMYDLYPEQRAEGSLLLDGRDLVDKNVDSNQLRARVGMVFQKPTPFLMAIYDKIAFGVNLQERLSRAEMDVRVEWALRKAAL